MAIDSVTGAASALYFQVQRSASVSQKQQTVNPQQRIDPDNDGDDDRYGPEESHRGRLVDIIA